MMLWLLLGLLLFPTLFAVFARIIARRGNARGAVLVAAAGFAGCAACAVALGSLPLDTASLGPLQAFVPATDTVSTRASSVDLEQNAAAGGSDQVSNSGDLGPTSTTEPTPTLEPTAAPTSLPEPTATPVPTSLPEPTAEPSSLPEPTAQTTTRPTADPEPEPAADPESELAAEPERYVVELGDTLWEIATLYDVGFQELQRYNGLSDQQSRNLQVGQVLFIPPR